MRFNKVQISLLKWIQLILLCVCGAVLIFMAFVEVPYQQTVNAYFPLTLIVMVILCVSHVLFRRKNYIISSRLLVLAGVIGPWASTVIDPSIAQGNLFPLVYLTIPIMLSSFFTPIIITTIVGVIQLSGLIFFTITNQIVINDGASSLFFFIIFIYVISLIFNYLNRFNQQVIDQQVNELNKLALHDHLTGLYNRHFLSEYLKKEFERTKRNGGELTIVILDIDDFKKYNDTLGHACGDSILRGLSQLLTENFRSSDIICRFGGDEFLISMSGISIADAQQRCRDLQSLISDKELKCTIELDKPLTLSIGIAAYTSNCEYELDLIRAADRALYRAKELGKNRIELANSE